MIPAMHARDRPAIMKQRVPVLVYHHVYREGDPGLAVTSRQRVTGAIGETEFRRQMCYISENGWEAVSTTRVVDWLEHGSTLTERSVALHFDNGWLDTRTVAMPILDELGMVATCYVISEAANAASGGRPAAVRTSTEGAVEKPCITWRHAEELLNAGWEIGAHTATHPKLADLLAEQGEGAVLREIERSSSTYAERLGFVPEHFAYPSGSRDERTDSLLAPFYRSLRLWSITSPPVWSFTETGTSPLALDCQNIDNTVAFDDFTRIFREALGG